MSVIPILGRQRQEDHEFEARLGYKVGSSTAWVRRPFLKTKTKI
jgi:hypothetical protein